MTKNAVTIQRSGWTWRAWPRAIFTRTQAMKPAPMPTVMLYVNGMSTIVRNAGNNLHVVPVDVLDLHHHQETDDDERRRRRLRGHDREEWRVNVASRNRMPVTTEARPVRAPSSTPAADSM